MSLEKKPKKKNQKNTKIQPTVEDILVELDKETKNEMCDPLIEKDKNMTQLNNVQNGEEINNFDILLPSNEPIVNMLNKHWTKIGDNIEEYMNYKIKTFLVDKNIFNMTKDQLEKFKIKNEESYKIYRFYKLHDNIGTSCVITSTLNTIYGCFCADVLCNLSQDSNNKSKFAIFKNAGATEIYVTPLKIIRTKMTKGINAELDKIRLFLETHHGDTNSYDKHDAIDEQCENANKMLKKIKMMICSFNLPKQKYYIQKIYLQSNPNKFYVVGLYEKLKQSDLVDFVFKKCIEIGNPTKFNLKVDVIKEVEIQIDVEGLLYVDVTIKELDTINNGLNRFYHVFQNNFLERSVTMHVQYALLYHKYAQLDVGDGEYIVNMKLKNMNYVYRGVGTNVMEGLKIYYLMTNHHANEHDRMIKLLLNTKIDDISVILLGRNIDKKYIDDEVCVALNLFQKETLLNYEVVNDEYVNQKEFKKEMTNVKSLIFSSKYKK